MDDVRSRWTWNRYARPIPRPPRGIEAQRLYRELQDHNPERTSIDLSHEGSLEHLSRYLFARPWITGRRVVDGGAGFGYGSLLLHRLGASMVLALERDLTALQLGASIARRIPLESVAGDQSATAASPTGMGGRPGFVRANLEACPLRDGSADLIVALEVLEHLERPERFLREARRVLSASGVLLISTPNRELVSPGWEIPPNRFHTREYAPGELETLLRGEFASVELTGQIPGPILIERRRAGRRGRRLAIWVERRMGFDPRRILPASWRRVGRKVLGDPPESGHKPIRDGEPSFEELMEARVAAWVSRGLEEHDPSLGGLYEYGPAAAGEMLIAVCHGGGRPQERA